MIASIVVCGCAKKSESVEDNEMFEEEKGELDMNPLSGCESEADSQIFWSW